MDCVIRCFSSNGTIRYYYYGKFMSENGFNNILLYEDTIEGATKMTFRQAQQKVKKIQSNFDLRCEILDFKEELIPFTRFEIMDLEE